MTPSSHPDETPPGGYVPWTPPGAPPAARWKDAIRPLTVILGGALMVAALVAWMSTRNQEVAPLMSGQAGGGMVGEAPASLLVDSEPIGATVWVNGDSVGVTPAWLPRVESGVVEVVLASETITHDTTLALRPGQDASVLIWLQKERFDREPARRPQEIQERVDASEDDASPEIVTREVEAPPVSTPARDTSPTGRLRITSAPEGAAVWMSGERVGQTPLSLDALPVGEQVIELRAPGYEPERLRLDIAANALTEEAIELRARPGIVSVVAGPGSRVFIDGTLQGTVRNMPLRLSLAAGRYEVRVFHPEQGEAFRVIEVAAGTALRIDFDRPESATPGDDASARGTESPRRRTGW